MTNSKAKSPISTPRWLLGMFQASVFSLVYLLAPPYIISAIVAVICQYPTKNIAWIYAGPLVLSLLSKPVALPNFIANYLKPMSDYFQFEEIHEYSWEELRKDNEKKKNYILAAVPHGVVSDFNSLYGFRLNDLINSSQILSFSANITF